MLNNVCDVSDSGTFLTFPNGQMNYSAVAFITENMRRKKKAKKKKKPLI